MLENVIDQSLADIAREYPQVDRGSKRLVYALFHVADRLPKVSERSLEEIGLTWGEYVVLATLRRKGPRASMAPKGLMESIGLSSGGISSILRRLEGRDLISRSPSTHDGRSVVVCLTAKGRKLADSGGFTASDRFLLELSGSLRRAG